LGFDGARQVMRKEDGSLISTYLHGDELRFKSKCSLTSQQAIDCLEFSDLEENSAFKKELIELENEGFTVNLEWTSPDNRIVLVYEKPALIVLCIRSKIDGRYLEESELDEKRFAEIKSRWVERMDNSDVGKFLEEAYEETGIEGYVIQLASGQFCKAKTKWYLSLHRTRDFLEGKKLFECVINESTDDLKSLYTQDKSVLRHIEVYEDIVLEILNDWQDRVQECFDNELTGKGIKLDGKKTWEIVSAEFPESYLRGLMMAFLKAEEGLSDKYWKEFLLKNWQHVKDKFPAFNSKNIE